MRVVLLGAPGAGKGTQAALAAERFEIPHISTGEMMRAAIASGSSIGQRARGFLDAGQLVPDEVMIDVVRERISEPDCKRGFLLDGFPRTQAQAEALERLCADIHCELTHVVEFMVPFENLKQRLLNRGQTGGRSDDTPAVIAERLVVYERLTRPVSNYYQAQATLQQVDGMGTIAEVHNRVVELLEKS